MSFTPQNLCGFLIRSRLMTPEEMRNMFQRWLAEGKDQSTSLGPFTQWLVANHYLTDYQATLLAKGHADPDVYFLNQYKILDRLGRGRMAGVYKAVHGSGQIVAIKVLPPSQAKKTMMLSRFQREARLAMRLKHPNVVRSFQIGQAAGLHFLVMEFLEGETLDEVLERRKRLPPNEAVRLLHQALTGLQHIHEQGMVHRDLKPSNLMLTPAATRGEPDSTLRATVKILDIGLGRVIFEDKQPAINKSEITGEGVILGTPDYLAPEQARDPRSIDIRADIYSLGCVLYHGLAGQSPFPDSNLINQMVRHATEAPKPLQQFNAAVPDGLQQIVSYMLAKQPAQRYPTPERAAQALQMFLMADSVASRPIDEAPQMRKYLTWLETAPPEETDAAAAKPGSGNHPAAQPETQPRNVANTPAPPSRPHGHKKHKKHKKRPHHGQPQPAALPAAATGQFDVELVTVPAAVPLAGHDPKILLGLNKRELTLLGIGGGAVLAVVILGIILGSMFK